MRIIQILWVYIIKNIGTDEIVTHETDKTYKKNIVSFLSKTNDTNIGYYVKYRASGCGLQLFFYFFILAF